MSAPAGEHQRVTDEARDAYQRYSDTRDRIVSGELAWDALEQYFTDDVVYIDPAWGRVEGIDAVRSFWVESMAGLEDWKFPEVWTVVDGPRVVTMWLQEMGVRPDETQWTVPGMSLLYYAGDGRFCYELDMLNMTHVIDVVGEMGWTPPGEFTMPPEHPDRDFSLPPGREHLAE